MARIKHTFIKQKIALRQRSGIDASFYNVSLLLLSDGTCATDRKSPACNSAGSLIYSSRIVKNTNDIQTKCYFDMHIEFIQNFIFRGWKTTNRD